MNIKPFKIKKVELISTITGDKVTIYNNVPPSPTEIDLISINVKESMFSPSLEGEAKLRDFRTWIDDLEISIGNYDTFRLHIEEGFFSEKISKTIDLSVYAYSQETSETEIQYGKVNVARLITLKLASKEHYIMNYNFFEFMEDDKVMRISLNKKEGSDGGESGDDQGLIQYLTDRLNAVSTRQGASGNVNSLSLKADNTRNWVWLKKNHNFYPWGKFTKPPAISQMFQMLAENAVDDTNNNAVNFFFWQNLDGWNFRSIEAINREYLQRQDIRTFSVSPLMNDANTIRSLNSGSEDEIHVSSYEETDFFDLLRSYAFGSLYTFVEPKYSEDPYGRYLDTQDSLIYQDIYYDYTEDGDRWLKIDGEPRYFETIQLQKKNRRGQQEVKDNVFIKNLGQNVIVDKQYGYFSPNFFNRYNSVSWEYNGYQRSNREEEELWQTQFDITDMKGEELKTIQEKIKKPLKKKKEEYAKKKNLKEKWKVYKCSVCCAGDIETGSGVSGGFPISLADEKFEKSFNLRNSGSLSNYEVVAAGSFTDTINYDAAKVGVGATGFTYNETGTVLTDEDGNPLVVTIQNEWTRSGMTLSYNLNESPYNLTLGEFFSLEKKPDNFVKYRFDLEIKRHEKLKEILLNNIQARKGRIKEYRDQVAGYTLAYRGRNNTCLESGCTGYCLCPTEYPETVTAKANLVTNAHTALIEHEEKILQYIQPNIDKLKALKNEFIELYDKYWSRKAFFFSRDIDFSFLKSQNNLFNVKSITRKPIRGSKYEPFAVRKAFSGYTFSNGYSAYYPYDVPPYWNDLGDTESGESIINAGFKDNIAGVTVDVYYGRKYDNIEQSFTDGRTSSSPAADFWSSFESPFSNFPYGENNEEKAKGPIWYRNWLVNYEISLIKPPCLNRKPPCFEGDCSCDEILLPLNMHFETFANGPTADILMGVTQVSEYAFTQLSKNCDGCKVRITNVIPSSAVKLYHPWAADGLSGGFGFDDYKNYKRAASLFKDKPGITGFYDNEDNELNDAYDKWTPPHLALEGLESYVRIEFKTPIGVETLKDFPEGFVDVYGSEYFLPYIVLATAGPFGSQSARANISVIGQDPYGFDLAVKKTKNKDDFAGMNLMYTDDPYGDVGDPNQSYTDYLGKQRKYSYPDQRFPFGTSSSWMRNSQNSMFYKPKDGISDLFVPSGIQDIFKASTLEKSFPAKTWWDMWVSLPPIAVSTFYNRWDVIGASGGSMKPELEEFSRWFGLPDLFDGLTYQGIGFYYNNSIVAKPLAWTGAIGPSACSGGCSEDAPWPLFLQPDTEQIISGAFPYNVAVQTPSDLLDSFGNLGNFYFTLDPGETAQNSSSILPSDPSNYIYNFAEFPHIIGMGPSGEFQGIMGIQRGLNYPIISYPVGTLIWGKNIDKLSVLEDFSGELKQFNDYNFVHRYDISRKTQYGLVQLSSDSMPSLITLIGGVGGSIQKAEQYNKWVSDRLIEWFQNSIFDNNFSGQFVVLSKQGDSCKGYPCMNPEGFPGIEGCTAGNPLCNCPCQGASGYEGKPLSSYITPGATGQMPYEVVLRPDLMDIVPDRFFGGVTFAPIGSYGPEPSSLELEILEKELNECSLVKEHLGEEWLGCVWDKPDSPYNCTCPVLGRRFPDYMKYNRTYSTFWETPLAAPLLRTAQMALLNSNKITIVVPGDLNVKTGQIVKIKTNNDVRKRFEGRWLITTINHEFGRSSHRMSLTLSREGQGTKRTQNVI
jgi:hypothetical protein